MKSLRGSLVHHPNNICDRKNKFTLTKFLFDGNTLTFKVDSQHYQFNSTEVGNIAIHKYHSNSNSISIELFVNQNNNHFHIFLNYDKSTKSTLENFWSVELPWNKEISDNRLKLFFHLIWISGVSTFLLLNFLILQVQFSNNELINNPQYSIYIIVISLFISILFYYFYHNEQNKQKNLKADLILSS